jgi:hypothetical protein
MDHLPGLWLSVKALMTLKDINIAKPMDWAEDATPN